MAKLYNKVTIIYLFTVFAVGVYLPEGRQTIIPFFQYSIIPVLSAAN